MSPTAWGCLLYTSKEVIGGPDVQSRGVIYLKDADHIVKEIGNIIERTVEDAVKEKRYENMAVRMEAKDRIVKYVLKMCIRDSYKGVTTLHN